MNKNLFDKYKKEMLEMYRSANVNMTVENTPKQPRQPEPSPTPMPAPVPESRPERPQKNTAFGNLIGIVTAVRGLYPVKNAKVTVFTGDYENMSIIDTALTDQSGRTKIFVLPTPEKALSLDEANTVLPYAIYNMAVEADGYIKNIHLNIPVFGTVTSLQQSNLLLEETAGNNKSPQIFDEAQKYDL